ncbi:MAG: hypothetical protein JXA71_09405, partial [Chitinispirillaceae bacterium]|nr:hypothetical protein [Chitinispirillaceae bacterium]
MKLAGKVIWIAISLVAALAIAVVAGVVNPGEKVNALWIVTAAACFYIISYRFYGSFIAARVLVLNAKRTT